MHPIIRHAFCRAFRGAWGLLCCFTYKAEQWEGSLQDQGRVALSILHAFVGSLPGGLPWQGGEAVLPLPGAEPMGLGRGGGEGGRLEEAAAS